MKIVLRFLFAAALALGAPLPAARAAVIDAVIVAACATPPHTYPAGSFQPVLMDTTGALCVNATVTASLTGSTSNASSGVATSSTNIPTVSYNYFFNGTTWDQAQDDGSKNLKVNCEVGCAGGSSSNASSGVATSSTNGATNAWLYGFNGTTWDQLQVDGSKNLKIDIAAGSIANTSFAATQGTSPWVVSNGGTFAVQATLNTTPTIANGNGVVPTQAGSVISAANPSFSALSIAGAVNASGNPIFAQITAGAAAIGSVTANAGTNLNTSALATSANQTNAAQKTQIVDGSGNVIASTSNNLDVQCANCSGSGVSTADEATFTAGTSLFAGSGGFFQTTATSNALTNGKQGMFQVTAQRALFANLRDSSGNEEGLSGQPLQVSLANTGANGTAVAVSLAANQSVNVAQINGVTPLMGNGVTGTGSPRVTIASNNTPFQIDVLGNAGATMDVAIGGAAAATNALQVGGVYNSSAPTLSTGNGAALQLTSAGSLHTTVDNANANGQATMANSSPVVIASNQSTLPSNTAQVNGVTTLTGAGATGTGAQRETVSQDTTTIAGSAPGTAGSASANVVTVQGVASMTPVTTVESSQYPATAVPITASATGTTAATTATLTNVSGHTTYICGYSVRANATAATTVANTVTGVITATMTHEMWVAPAASGLGVDEQIFTPCIPASAVSTSIAVVSGAPGSGGLVSVTAWGYSL